MSEVNASAPAPAPSEATHDHDPKTGAGGAGVSGGSGDLMKDAAREAIRKHKLKVDGQEIEVDEDELKRGYSHQRAANKILQEGKAARKQAEEFVRLMKDEGSLFDAIKKLGHDPRKLAEKYLASQLEDEMLDPREKDFRATKAELQRYKELEKVQKDALEKQRDDSLKKKFSEDYSKQFVEALKTSSLPQTKEMVAEMAKYIHRAAKMQFQMTADEAAKLVKEDIENAHRNLYGNSDAEVLVRLLGDQGLQKIRAYDTARLKDPNAQLKTPTEQGEPRQRPKNTGKRMTTAEWRAFNRK